MFYTYTLLCFLYKAILQLQITWRGIRKRKTSTRHTTNWAYSLSNPGNYPPGAGQAQADQDRRCSVAATAKCQWESVRGKEAESEWNCQRKQEKQRKLTPRLHPTAPCCCCCAAMVCLPTGAAAADRVWVRTTLASLLNEPCCAWEETERSNWLQLVQVGEKSESVRKKSPQISFSCHRKVHKMRNHSKKYINK